MRIVDRIVGNPASNAFAANAQVDQDLPRVAVYDSLWLRLAGTLTLAAYSVAPTKYNESALNLIGSVQVVAVGALQDTIKATDYAWLHRQTQFMEGTAPFLTDVGTSNAAFNFESGARVYFRNPRSVNPLATLLDARRLAGLTFRVIWRDQTAMVTGGTGGTAVLSNTAVTVLAREYYDLPAPVGRVAFAYMKEQQRGYGITGSQTEYLVPNLPVGNRYRRLCFKGMVTSGNATFADNTDTLFNNASSQNLKVRDGATFPVNSNYFAMRARNKQFFTVESMPAGYVLWEPQELGADGETYDARMKRQLEALVDVNFTGGNTNTLQVTSVELVRR